MSNNQSNLSITKKIVFTLISTFIFFVILGLMVTSYFGYKKLTLSYAYCNSFGEIHSEIGWVLKKNIDSCLKLSNKISGEVFFDSSIYTDNNGFRTQSSGNSSSSSILSIGDSWTFGYGVNGDETYPYFLSKLLGQPIFNSGVPAFGSASTYLYAKSNIEKLKPKTVIYLTRGLWRRSTCLKPWSNYIEDSINNKQLSLYRKQLIPCFFIDQEDFNVKLLEPLTGVVKKSVENHVYPGGSLTAGYDSFWSYVFFTKPKLVYQSFKERVGLSAIKVSTPLESYQIKKFELNSFLDLAKKNNFQFILVDPYGDYKQIIVNKDVKNLENLLYISKSYWNEYMEMNTKGTKKNELYIPKDGHFSKKMNEIVANLIYQKILSNNSSLKK